MPKSKAYYRNKADRLFQEIGRKKYDTCLICPKPLSCLHHYYPKSSAGNLRYNFNNGIPLCAGHHLRHHCGYPEIQNEINFIKGDEWLAKLKEEKKNFIKCDTIGYYKDKVAELQEILDNL
jgi:hypothetical protein